MKPGTFISLPYRSDWEHLCSMVSTVRFLEPCSLMQETLCVKPVHEPHLVPGPEAAQDCSCSQRCTLTRPHDMPASRSSPLESKCREVVFPGAFSAPKQTSREARQPEAGDWSLPASLAAAGLRASHADAAVVGDVAKQTWLVSSASAPKATCSSTLQGSGVLWHALRW